MMTFRSTNDLFASDGLASVATRLASADSFTRGGSVQRAQAAMGRGASLGAAVVRTAPTAKGLLAERAQADSYTSRAAALGKARMAVVNPLPNDPLHDVLVLASDKKRTGRQLKNGGPRTIKQAIKKGAYDNLVVPTEHIDEVRSLAVTHGLTITDRVECEVVSAEPLSIIESHELTSELLVRVLLQEDLASVFDKLGAAARAGVKDGLSNAALAIIGHVADDLYHHRPIDLGAAARAGIHQGSVAAARTSVQTMVLMSDLRVRAGQALSAGVLRRAAAGATIVGAIADVVVATALDAFEVLRGRMTKSEMYRRAGVHTFEAGGAAAGVLLAYYVTRSAPWWVSLLAGIAAGYLGGQLGRDIGEDLFMPKALPAITPLHLPAASAAHG